MVGEADVASPAGATHAFRWTAASGLQVLGSLGPGFLSHRASYVSADGAIVGGTAFGVGGRRILLWSAATGMRDVPNFDLVPSGPPYDALMPILKKALAKDLDERYATAYEFAVVQVFDRKNPLPVPPAIHAVYWPTTGLKTGDEITFKVRTFGVRADEGEKGGEFGAGG